MLSVSKIRQQLCSSTCTASRSIAASARRKPRGRHLSRLSNGSNGTMKVAINGCCHGDLDLIYSCIRDAEQRGGFKVDLLLCCGDFQAMRSVNDLHCFACPPKYRAMKDFHKYYTGKSKAYVPTIFVGGNHEAANHLWELYYGGWAAPDIFYLGHAGVINFGGLRIAGLSGIWNAAHYSSGHFESPPYDRSTVRSAYHVRDLEVYRLLKVKEKVDIFMSHDWPNRVARYGDTAALFKKKPYFRAEVEKDDLGSPANWQLLEALKPRFWFAGHLHVAYPAVVPHSERGVLQPGDKSAASTTKFMATDKPVGRRKYVQIVDVPVAAQGDKVLKFDEEWLAIMRETHELMNLRRGPTRFPTPFSAAPPAAQEHRDAVSAALAAEQYCGPGGRVPDGFVETVDASQRGQGKSPTSVPRNPQTAAVLRLIGRPWNLSHDTGAGAGVPLLTGDDLMADGGDEPSPHGDPMFDPLEINNFDPFAFSDAKDAKAAKRPKLSAMLAGARSPPDPSAAARSMSAANAAERPAANPEEIDIGTDSE